MLQKFYISFRLLPIYFLFVITWFLTGIEKFKSEGVPPWFSEKFSSTFLANFPGLTFSYYQIGVSELLAGTLFIISLIKLEFLPKKSQIFLRLGLWMSMVNFSQLGFGARLVNDHTGAANLFFYFGATAATLALVELTADPK